VSSNRSYLAIALTSCAILIFEIAATRILSVVHWYHWAFLCVSLAMLGLGAPGVWFTFAKRPERFLPPLLWISALLLPLSVIAIVKLGEPTHARGILFSMVCLLLPMLSLGGAVCLLLMEAKGSSIARMYAFDLAGACVGAVLVIPLMHVLPTPWLIGALGFLPLAAYFCVTTKRAWWALGAGVVVLALLIWREPFALHYSKAYKEVGVRRPFYEKWTPTARLTFFNNVFWAHDKEKGFAWGKGTHARPQKIEQYWVEQDGSAGTPITRFKGDIASVAFLFDDVTTVGYQLRRPRSTAIIGAGGGRDILSARLAGSDSIDAIELNRHIIHTLSTRLVEFDGDVYHLPGVNAIAGEGRSALTRSHRRYDMIQISLIDSWAATAAGAFALSENNLYTVEAFRLYYYRLAPTGMISASRWIAGVSIVEVPRAVLLAQEALRQEGVADPNAHLAVVQGGAIGTLLVSKPPFTHSEIDSLAAIARTRGFDLHYPITNVAPADSTIATVVVRGASAFPDPELRLDPPTDDRPFFFQVVPPFHPVDKAFAARYRISGGGMYALQVLMVVMAVVATAFFLLPFVFSRRLRATAGAGRGSLFFGSIGVAFMLVEIPCVQRFVLYLGHPSYSTTVVLASILLGASLGSMTSARIGLTRLRRLGWLLPLLVVALNVGSQAIFTRALGWELGARVALTVIGLLPIAFCMGLFFPLGMLRFGDANKPWFWAVNGAAGVLASVFAVALSMEIGFSGVLWLASASYVLAWLLIWGRATTTTEAPATPV
jgi:spermidine synthase